MSFGFAGAAQRSLWRRELPRLRGRLAARDNAFPESRAIRVRTICGLIENGPQRSRHGSIPSDGCSIRKPLIVLTPLSPSIHVSTLSAMLTLHFSLQFVPLHRQFMAFESDTHSNSDQSILVG
jgi:hypothetical protein